MNVSSLLVLLAALASAEPSKPPVVSVVVARRAAVAPDTAQDVAAQVTQVLQDAGVPIALPPASAAKKLAEFGVVTESCEGARDCVLTMAAKIGAQVVVAIEVGAVGQAVAIHLEAFALPDGKRLAKHDVLVQMEGLRKLSGLGDFGGRLKVALAQFVFESKTVAPPPPPVLPATHEIVAVAPIGPETVPAPAIEAKPKEHGDVVVTKQARSNTHYVVGGATLGAAAIAAALGLTFGLQAKAAGADWQTATTASDWQSAQDKAHSRAKGATASWAVAGVLAAASTVCFIVEF